MRLLLTLRGLQLAEDRMTQAVKVWPTQLGIEAVRSGAGITLLSASAVPEGVSGVNLVRILDEAATLRRSIIWKAEVSQITRELIGHLSKVLS